MTIKKLGLITTLLAALASIASATTIQVNGTTLGIAVARGATVSVAVADGPANARDWVARADLGSALNAHAGDWQYLTSANQSVPSYGTPGNVLTFTLPNTDGTFVFRVFAADGYTLLVQSAPVTIGGDVNPNGNGWTVEATVGTVDTIGHVTYVTSLRFRADGGTWNTREEAEAAAHRMLIDGVRVPQFPAYPDEPITIYPGFRVVRFEVARIAR